MSYYFIDPLEDQRWTEFIERHPSSSVFHTPAWLRALQRTFRYTPVVLTTAPPGIPLADGIAFCRIRSAITGARMVSLPFSDHCQPLSASEELLRCLPEICAREKSKYVELRPLEPLAPASPAAFGLAPCFRYRFHVLDLRPPLEDIFRRFHADCIRRKIRRAEREGLECEAGRSDRLQHEFYELQVITRRRHGIPPQPREWFENIVAELGEQATIRVARHQGRAIASIITLQHKKTATYKYGCSDAADNNRGGTQLIMWQAIETAKAEGMESMDLGRGGIEDEDLSQFKERWGAQRQEITYLRCPPGPESREFNFTLLSRLPKAFLVMAGRLLYRHIG
jgi:CelD/BcsL family acetyltransferase involved in cellulose biosynthesis